MNWTRSFKFRHFKTIETGTNAKFSFSILGEFKSQTLPRIYIDDTSHEGNLIIIILIKFDGLI